MREREIHAGRVYRGGPASNVLSVRWTQAAGLYPGIA